MISGASDRSFRFQPAGEFWGGFTRVLNLLRPPPPAFTCHFCVTRRDVYLTVPFGIQRDKTDLESAAGLHNVTKMPPPDTAGCIRKVT